MTRTAEILKKMVESGEYKREGYMCIALQERINKSSGDRKRELLEAQFAVEDYVQHLNPNFCSLFGAVQGLLRVQLLNESPHYFSDLFSDWDNRPMVAGAVHMYMWHRIRA